MYIKYIRVLIMFLLYCGITFHLEANIDKYNPFRNKQTTTGNFQSGSESGFHINNDLLFNKSNTYRGTPKSGIPVLKDPVGYTVFSEQKSEKNWKKTSSIYKIYDKTFSIKKQNNLLSYSSSSSVSLREFRANEDPDDPNGNEMPGQDLPYDPDDPNGNPMLGEAPLSGSLFFLYLFTIIYTVYITTKRYF